MQISSKEFFRSQLTGMSDLQSRIGRLQEEISTGKKLLQPSDDPSGYVKVQSLKQTISAVEQYDRNINVATQRLTQEETALGQAVNTATRLQELILQGTSDSSDPQTRKVIAQELKQIREQLVSIANSTDSNGEFIFSGYKSTNKPFIIHADNSISFGGDSGRREVEISKGVTVATGSSGQEVFMHIAGSSNEGTKSVFDLIDQAITKFEAGLNSSGSVVDMKNVLDQFTTYQTIAGSRLQKVDSMKAIGDAAITSAKIIKSSLEDSKIEEVATELSQKSLNLTASQTTFAKIAQLSLFNFLR